LRTCEHSSLILNFKAVEGVFPNVCVPLAGILETTPGFEFEFYYLSDYLKKTAIRSPLRVGQNTDTLKNTCLDRIWRFENFNDISAVLDAFRQKLQQVVVCEKGVLEAFEWGLNEVLDNVLRHSGKEFGYVMGQVHQASRNFVFCVYDTGRGIYGSLANSAHQPKTPEEALELAVSENVTRDKLVGQGNGLYVLRRIISENTGKLNIISNAAWYKMDNGDTATLPFASSPKGCVVDFQLNCAKEIRLDNVLESKRHPPNLWVEALEDGDGAIVVSMKEKNAGTGTRQTGEMLRNEIINLHKQSGKKIILDFQGISVISSGFADELIGKLMVELGLFECAKNFQTKNMAPTVRMIVQRSAGQRMMEENK